MIWALLCGVFYGWLVCHATERERVEKRLDRGMGALLEDLYGPPAPFQTLYYEGGDSTDLNTTGVDLYAMTHTGYEDG